MLFLLVELGSGEGARLILGPEPGGGDARARLPRRLRGVMMFEKCMLVEFFASNNGSYLSRVM